MQNILLTSTRLGALVIGLAIGGAPAFASGFTDLNAGISARNIGDEETAIRYLTLALSAPDLPTQFLPIVRFDRAEAYTAQGRLREAVADFDAAIALRSGWYDALDLRGIVRGRLGDRSGAEADLAAAIAVRSDLVDAYYARSSLYAMEERYQDALNDSGRTITLAPLSPEPLTRRAHIYELAGQFDLALQDVKKARVMTADKHAFYMQIGIIDWALGKDDDASDEFDYEGSDQPANLYANIWRLIAEKFSDRQQKRFESFTSGIDLTKWPGPIGTFYLGKITLDQLRQAEEDKSPALTLDHRCEGEFYTAEFLLAHHDASGAQPLLQSAMADCPIDFVERPAVKFELSRQQGGVPHAAN